MRPNSGNSWSNPENLCFQRLIGFQRPAKEKAYYMAYLTFRTPDGDHCNWSSRGLAYSDDKSPYCKFFQEFLGHSKYPVEKCPQCKALGKYGTKKGE